MKLKLIAAVASNGVIGRHNALPWHLPEDLAFFKKTTTGHPIVMGRKTWDSIGRPLPKRLNVVLSRDAQWAPCENTNAPLWPSVNFPNTIEPETRIAVATDLGDTLEWLRPLHDTLFLIGGATLYAQALEQDLVDEMILTEIHQEFEGDAWFPEWDKQHFEELERLTNSPTDSRPWSYDYVRYTRTHTIKGV